MMSQGRYLKYVCLAWLLCAACGQPRDVDGTSSKSEEIWTARDEVPTIDVEGFLLTEFTTAVTLTLDGADVEVLRDGMVRKVGNDCVFMSRAQDFVSGAYSISRLGRAEPFSGSSDDHGQEVSHRFRAAGLPAMQVGKVTTGVTVRAWAPKSSTDPAKDMVQELESYTTIINREVEGIPIVGSIAMGRIDASGEMVMQFAYWPPLAKDVIEKAKAFKQDIERDREAFVSKVEVGHQGVLDEDMENGEVVVQLDSPARHPAPVVAYKVPGSGNGPIQLFSPDGVLLKR